MNLIGRSVIEEKKQAGGEVPKPRMKAIVIEVMKCKDID